MEWLVVFTAAKEMRQGLYPESLLAAPISQRIYEMLVRLSGRGACVALANRIVGDPDKFGGHAAELAAKLLQDSSDTDQNEQPFIPQFPWLDWLNNRGDESAISRLAFECFQTPVIRVRALRIRNIRSFEDTGIICFCEGGGATRTVTLIVGDNAAGKSTLLQCLAIAFLGPALANQLNIPIEGLLRHKAKAGFIEVEFEFRDQLSVVDAPSSFFVGIELRAGETGFRSADRRDCMLLNGLREESENSALRLDAVRRLDHGGIGFLCAYGPWRTLNVEPSSSLTQHPNKVLDRVFSLFHSETLVMDPDLLSRIISGQVVTTGTTVPVGLDNEMKRLLCKTICDVVPNLSIAEEQAGRLVLHGVPLALRALSDGYGSLLALIGHVVHHGVEFRSASAPLRLPVGLVLIDEIDLHLHPSWQRRILSDLTRSFPEAQFVVSSHSPMVAGSTPSDGIVLLRREGERIAIRSDIGSVQGWRADQILTSALFDLDSSRDIGTSNLIERYTQLSIADSLSVDEKDELKEIAAQLRIRLPTSAEKAHARQASKIIEATYRMQFDALPVEEKERLVVELRAQLLEAMTQSRRPE